MMQVNELRARCVLLDIEGTVSDVRFVFDVMFPFAKRELEPFLDNNWNDPRVMDAIRTVAKDAGHNNPDSWLGAGWSNTPEVSLPKLLEHLHGLMATDSKTTGLKMLQGMVWQSGFETGELQAELFDDVLPALKKWKEQELDIRIYSSGSILAQKMFFKHTAVGNLSVFFSAHYDTTIGPKKESDSYRRIAEDSHFDPSDIVFVSDVAAELLAAQQAGMQAVASVRPNNAPLSTEFTGLTVTTFAQLQIVLPGSLSDS